MPGTRFGARTLARSQALQLLFQSEACGRLVSDVLAGDYLLDFGALAEGAQLATDRWPLDPYAAELALGADGMLHELDRAIDASALNWSVSRMPSVDRNLLRLAVYELVCRDEVAPSVTINEFVELAKAYGTDESSRFVNGVLGRVAARVEQGEDIFALEDAASDVVQEVPSAPTGSEAPAAMGQDVSEPAPASDGFGAADAADSSPASEDAPAGDESSADEDAPAVGDVPAAERVASGEDASFAEKVSASGEEPAAELTPADEDLPEWARG